MSSNPRPVAGGKRRRPRSQALGMALAWLRESGWRLLAWFVLVWLVILCHTLFTEAAEFRAAIADQTGAGTRLLIPGTAAPDPEDRWTAVWADRLVLPGDTLRTDEHSTVTLDCCETSVLRLNESSMLTIGALAFDRETGARRRRIGLLAGSVLVRSGPGLSDQSEFTVTTSRAEIGGFNASWYADGGVVVATHGTVTIKPLPRGTLATLTAGQAYDQVAHRVRTPSADERKLAEKTDTALPEAETGAEVRTFLVNLEERVVLAHSGWLLAMVHHEPGAGNPFAGWSLVNSSRRAQAEKRLKDLHEAMTSTHPPASVRLDEVDKLGIDKQSVDLFRQAVYRGQLMSYTASGDEFRATAQANDRQKTRFVVTQTGVTK